MKIAFLSMKKLFLLRSNVQKPKFTTQFEGKIVKALSKDFTFLKGEFEVSFVVLTARGV